MVTAELQFLSESGGRPIYMASSPGRDASFSVDRELKSYSVDIVNARTQLDPGQKGFAGQSANGFDLINHRSGVSDFLDSDQIQDLYETEIEQLLKDVTGGSRVHIFDHTLRASDSSIRESKNLREPATLVHNDYTVKSGFNCLRENLEDEVENLLQQRFQIINIWRPLVDPVINFPLVLCDARSIDRADLVDAERRARHHTGEILLAAYSSDQRWYYYPEMRPDEVLLFKTFDSINHGNEIASIHTSINIPGTPADSPPRESIESRAFVFYANE